MFFHSRIDQNLNMLHLVANLIFNDLVESHTNRKKGREEKRDEGEEHSRWLDQKWSHQDLKWHSHSIPAQHTEAPSAVCHDVSPAHDLSEEPS